MREYIDRIKLTQSADGKSLGGACPICEMGLIVPKEKGGDSMNCIHFQGVEDGFAVFLVKYDCPDYRPDLESPKRCRYMTPASSIGEGCPFNGLLSICGERD